MGQIRGILFDSGDTLVRPKSGSWFPKQRFLDVFAAHDIRNAVMNDFGRALERGEKHLDDNHQLTTEDQERKQFREFNTIVVEDLGVAPTVELIDDLMGADDEVYSEPFPDTHRVLQQLQTAGIKLGIVSDNWPSLDRRYRALGLRDFFSSFVISAVVGCSKPCEQMYRTAIDEIGLPPESLMFVDDSPANVDAAVKLGLNGVVISR
jgi:putative hydrolase of the HAD superfamily